MSTGALCPGEPRPRPCCFRTGRQEEETDPRNRTNKNGQSEKRRNQRRADHKEAQRSPREARTGHPTRKGMNVKQSSGWATEERLGAPSTANSGAASGLRETPAVNGPLHNAPLVSLSLCLKIQKQDPNASATEKEDETTKSLLLMAAATGPSAVKNLEHVFPRVLQGAQLIN